MKTGPLKNNSRSPCRDMLECIDDSAIILFSKVGPREPDRSPGYLVLASCNPRTRKAQPRGIGSARQKLPRDRTIATMENGPKPATLAGNRADGWMNEGGRGIKQRGGRHCLASAPLRLRDYCPINDDIRVLYTPSLSSHPESASPSRLQLPRCRPFWTSGVC